MTRETHAPAAYEDDYFYASSDDDDLLPGLHTPPPHTHSNSTVQRNSQQWDQRHQQQAPQQSNWRWAGLAIEDEDELYDFTGSLDYGAAPHTAGPAAAYGARSPAHVNPATAAITGAAAATAAPALRAPAPYPTSHHLQHNYPDPGGVGGESAAASSYYSLHTPQGEWLEHHEQDQQHLAWELWQPPPPSLQRDRQAAVPARLDGGSGHNPPAPAPDRGAPPATPTARSHAQQHQRTGNADAPQVVTTTSSTATRPLPSPSSPLLPTGANTYRPAAHRPAPLSTPSASPYPNFITPLISTPTRSPAAPGPSTPSRAADPLRRPAASPTHTTTTVPTPLATSSLAPAPPRQLPRIAPSPRAAASAAALPQPPALYSLDSYGNAPHLGVGLRLSVELGMESQPQTLAASRDRHTYPHGHRAFVGRGAAMDAALGTYGDRSVGEDSEAENGDDGDGDDEDGEDGDYFGPLSTRSAAAAARGVAAPVASSTLPSRAGLGGRFPEYFRGGGAGNSHHSSRTNQQGQGHDQGREHLQAQLHHQQQVHLTELGPGLGLGLGLVSLGLGWGRGLGNGGGGGGGLGLLSAAAGVDRGRWREADQLDRVGVYEPTSGGGGGGGGAGSGNHGGGYHSDEDGGTVSSESSDSSDSSWGDHGNTLWPTGVQGYGASSRAAGAAVAGSSLPALRTGGGGGGRGGEVTVAAAGWRLPTPPSALGAGQGTRQLRPSLSVGHAEHGRVEGRGGYTPLPGGPSPRLARLSEASALSPSASGPWRPWEAAEEAQHRGGGGGGGGGAAADPWVDRSLAATALGPSSRLHRPTEPDSRRQPLPPHSTHQSHDYHHNHSHNRQQHNHHHDSGRYGAREQGGLHAQGQGPYGCVTASLDSPLLSLPLHTGAPERRRAGLQSATRRSLPLPIDPFAAASSYSTAAQPPSAVPAVPYLYDFQDDGQSDQDEEEYEVEDVLEPERHAGVGIGRSGAEGGGGGGGGGGGLAAGPGVLTSLQLQEWMSQHASRLLLPRHLHDIADLVFRPPSAVPLAEKRPSKRPATAGAVLVPPPVLLGGRYPPRHVSRLAADASFLGPLLASLEGVDPDNARVAAVVTALQGRDVEVGAAGAGAVL